MEMEFEIDKQTLEDLNIYAKSINTKSIAGLFDQTKSFLGKSKIYELLETPLSDYEKLEERTETIQFFLKNSWLDLQLDIDALNFAEYYQKQRRNTIRPIFATAFFKHLYDKLNNDAQYFLMEEGVYSTIKTLRWINDFTQKLLHVHENDETKIPTTLLKQCKKIEEIFSRNGYDKLIKKKKIGRYLSVGKLDYQFRIQDRRDILFCLDLIYQYDAFSTIARVTHEKGFTFANIYKPDDGNRIELKGLFHPLLDNAVPNDVILNSDSNLLFLSGPNMAGKSTLLKSMATAVFLAHVGFPVPAASADISILSGLATTINIADNLSYGHSHFYAEVMRVKHVALRLKERKNKLIIFDELFRGTNVKDAYDGTAAVIKAFSKVKSAFFVMSTHIVEVADEFKDIKNIKFNYLDIEYKNGHPTYSYQVKDGISKDRLGMYIIQQENLIELIESSAEQKIN